MLKHLFKKVQIFVGCFFYLFAPTYLNAQGNSPDSLYFSQTKIASSISARYSLKNIDDTLVRRKLIDSGLAIYKNLDKKYFFQNVDIDEYLDLSYRAQNSNGFISAYRRKVMASAYDYKKVISAFKGKEIVPNQEFAKTLQQMERESDSLVKVAKMRLNWDDIVLIMSMWTSDIEFRMYASDYLFKDSIGLPTYYLETHGKRTIDLSLGKIIGFERLDSVHICTLYSYVKENGFPGERRAGMYSSFIWVILRHGMGLLGRKDASVSQAFLEKYKYLIPIAYEYAQKGEYTRVRYNYVHKDLLEITKEFFGDDAYNYFLKYTLKDL